MMDVRSTERNPGGFNPWPLVACTLVALLAIGASANWYDTQVAPDRYCGAIDETIGRLRRVLEEPDPAAGEPRREYLVAAKLLFLLPQEADEANEAYLRRMERYLRNRCR